jgi:hypothetical protein
VPLQHADAASVEQLLEKRRSEILESDRFLTALSVPAGDEDTVGTDAMLPITASHALNARLVQSGHGSAEVTRELLAAVTTYPLPINDSSAVFHERIMDHMLAPLSADQLKSQFPETCEVLLRQCKFAQFERFLRQRVAVAHTQLQRHLDEYIRLVLQEMAKYYTSDNEVVGDDEYVLTHLES